MSVNSTEETARNNKKKAVFASAADLESLMTMAPKLEVFIKVLKEIAAGHQKYRKNGGVAIPGIEKHVGIMEVTGEPSPKKKETATKAGSKAAKKGTETKKPKKVNQQAISRIPERVWLHPLS